MSEKITLPDGTEGVLNFSQADPIVQNIILHNAAVADAVDAQYALDRRETAEAQAEETFYQRQFANERARNKYLEGLAAQKKSDEAEKRDLAEREWAVRLAPNLPSARRRWLAEDPSRTEEEFEAVWPLLRDELRAEMTKVDLATYEQKARERSHIDY